MASLTTDKKQTNFLDQYKNTDYPLYGGSTPGFYDKVVLLYNNNEGAPHNKKGKQLNPKLKHLYEWSTTTIKNIEIKGHPARVHPFPKPCHHEWMKEYEGWEEHKIIRDIYKKKGHKQYVPRPKNEKKEDKEMMSLENKKKLTNTY